MNTKRRQANIILLLAAAIWGFAFVAQRVSMDHLGPLTFNGLRFALGSLVLLPFLFSGNRTLVGEKRPSFRELLPSGAVAGFFILGGATLQQYGVVYTTAGKAGFITGLYVLFVPLFGLFFRHRVTRMVWGGVALAVIGLYLLSATGWTSIALGDGLVLLGAMFWAGHVLWIDRLVTKLPPLPIAVSQFVFVSLASFTGALIFEEINLPDIRAAALPIAYAGVLSVGGAYTMQVVAQRNAKPAHAAIILSMESVFAAIGGWLLLSEGFSPRGLLGCALMLGGILLAQVDGEKSS
jgi:drug/metabolite transporter (DMT)-like permease